MLASDAQTSGAYGKCLVSPLEHASADRYAHDPKSTWSDRDRVAQVCEEMPSWYSHLRSANDIDLHHNFITRLVDEPQRGWMRSDREPFFIIEGPGVPIQLGDVFTIGVVHVHRQQGLSIFPDAQFELLLAFDDKNAVRIANDIGPNLQFHDGSLWLAPTTLTDDSASATWEVV